MGLDAIVIRRLRRTELPIDTVELARELIGRVLAHDLPEGRISGRIVETEAYVVGDASGHAFRGPTPRNMVMFGPPGFAYVYRSYGIHWCVNFVCEMDGSAAAVLIRALEPTHGIPAMRRRRGLHDERLLCSGPGKLCQALGISIAHNALPLDVPPIAIFQRTDKFEVVAGVRIGITKAADLPWRYGLKESKFLSKPFKNAGF